MQPETPDASDALDPADLPDPVDGAAVRRMRVVAFLLDDAVRIPGTEFRVGLDPVLGLLPGSGDIAAGALSLYIVAESARLGVSYGTLVRMLGNVAVDVGVGAIPLVGDLLDAGWKANRRNVRLALDDLAADGAEPREGAFGDGGETVEIEVE